MSMWLRSEHSSESAATDKRRDSRRRTRMVHRLDFRCIRRENFPGCRFVHRTSTVHPHVFHRERVRVTLKASMAGRSGLAAVVALCAWCSAASVFASEKYLYRIFLQDGTTLVSYGEYARVENRVVFSIPVGAAEPALQLVSIADSAVDWHRTEEDAQAVRARRYAETRGEEDFAALSAHVARALNEVVHTKDPAQRLALALEARGNLAEWP